LTDNPNYVCKLKKALYGLKQAPRAWYYRLDKFLQEKGFKKGIFISQENYLREMLKKFQMEDSSIVSTPMVVGCKLSKDDISPDVDQKTYRSMIGSLMYITTSRPNIMQAVGMVGHFQFAPKQSHLVAVKRIFKYLKGTMTYGLWYPRNKNFQLTAYSDADWANCVDERKRTSGGAFFLGDSLVAWLSKKQGSISLSTT
jgi:hypothetical protein